MRQKTLIWVLAAWVLGPGVARADKLSSAQREKLGRNEILIWYWKDDKTYTGTGKSMGVVDARPEQVFRLLTDVERFKEWMNRMVESKITRRDGKQYHFYYKIDMPWPLDDYWCLTKNINYQDKKRGVFKRRWSLIKGTFHKNDGYWYLERFPGGKTLVTYWCQVKPKTAVPQFVINYVIKKSLRRSISNIRERVAALKGRGEL